MPTIEGKKRIGEKEVQSRGFWGYVVFLFPTWFLGLLMLWLPYNPNVSVIYLGVGFLWLVLSWVRVMYVYIVRDRTENRLVYAHMTWLIKTFWYASLYNTLCIIPSIVLVSLNEILTLEKSSSMVGVFLHAMAVNKLPLMGILVILVWSLYRQWYGFYLYCQRKMPPSIKYEKDATKVLTQFE